MDGTPLFNSVAPLRNVGALVELIDRVQKRGHGLPGMATFYGPSGYGKTTAAIYAANKYRAYQVQVKSAWTAKKLCTAILQDQGLQPARTIADMGGAASIGAVHVSEAIQYRSLDRLMWV